MVLSFELVKLRIKLMNQGKMSYEVKKMILGSLGGSLIFLASLIIMLYLVPWAEIKSLALLGLVGGLGVAIVLLYFMQNLLGFWEFYRVDLISIWDVPIFLSAAWVPTVITFSYLLLKFANYPAFTDNKKYTYEKSSLLAIGGLVLLFPLAATVVHFLLITNGMLFYHNWNLSLTFLVSLVIHLGILSYLYATGLLRINTMKTRQEI